MSMTKKQMQDALFDVYCKHRKSWLQWETALDNTDSQDNDKLELLDRIATKEFHKVNAIEEVASELFPHTDFYGMWIDTIE